MTKNEVVKKVVAVVGSKTEVSVSKDLVANVIDAYAGVVIDELSKNKDERINLGAIGVFKTKHVPQREGIVQIGSKKGTKWTKPAHDEITFSVSKKNKEI